MQYRRTSKLTGTTDQTWLLNVGWQRGLATNLLHRLKKVFFINWLSLKFIRPLNGLTFHCNACAPDQYISISIYVHPQPKDLCRPPYFMQFLLCSFAFLCKVTHRGSITIVNRLRKLLITSPVGHNESDTPLTLKLEMWRSGLSSQRSMTPVMIQQLSRKIMRSGVSY